MWCATGGSYLPFNSIETVERQGCKDGYRSLGGGARMGRNLPGLGYHVPVGRSCRGSPKLFTTSSNVGHESLGSQQREGVWGYTKGPLVCDADGTLMPSSVGPWAFLT